VPETAKVLRLTVVLLLSVCASIGCSAVQRVVGFKDQVARSQLAGRIAGRIETEKEAEGTLVVVLARPGEDGRLVGVDSFVRLRPGNFAFQVTAGRYQLGAYEDRNRNGLLDPGELVVRVSESPVIELVEGGEVIQDLLIRRDAVSELTEPLDVLGLVERSPREQGEFSLWAWSVIGGPATDLDDGRFSAASGERGLWQIMDFLSDGLAGIYFIEPFDPDRIPVLFVHGIAGYPQQFSPLIDALDRDRFQPWFYFYPSGFGLDGISSHLQVLLERLQSEHGFNRLAVVAHSMGGLVSRGAIIKYESATRRDDVRLFISIATPWQGDVKAVKAGEAPVELPQSFSDMNPSSDYLRWLFEDDERADRPRRLPESAEFHMLFGFGMKRAAAAASDGTVTLASQLRPAVQEQARTERGYDESHTGILRAPAVIERVNALLEARFH